MSKSHTTIEYYDCNAEKFCSDTREADFNEVQDKFLGFLKQGDKILDLGCGSGRDTKYFVRQGFNVDAVDGSKELCKAASEFTGIPVRQMLFQELDLESIYDGIWACASILHLTYQELKNLFRKLPVLLKAGGILYVSFKYGEWEGFRNGRYFIDMTEGRVREILDGIDTLKIKEMWMTSDVRPEREQEKWLNIIIIRNFQNQK